MPADFRGQVDINEEIDVARVDPLFVERQRNRYASRSLAYIIWLNGLAAIALLIVLANGSVGDESTKRFADAMMVFGIGAAAGLASACLLISVAPQASSCPVKSWSGAFSVGLR
jgi:hypothetical protein